MSDTASEKPQDAQQDGAAEAAKKPFLTVVKGNPDPTQVATLTALFATMANNAAQAQEPERERNLWGSVEERLQRPTTYNPAAFRNMSLY
ncbi:acyl-CoA carboxylase subunit epsilon [Corynebacterium kozikiae]|uniref:acyl-CoA carboxylase subunit epsilon n=1 Tax=Corynebacterium kozikiae TaxID=2968469 RepID=UPI00211C762B|nr:acyl-CoA carboxylase subunit epsilon [Corynebacterium sp. 76QC2CO]MCQ9343134.1 acyl-CoA carboxylase subunit epsilon [Corynebacterium sp. 76QC2CO]